MKKHRFKEWLSSVFPSPRVIYYTPNGPERHAEGGSFFSHAQGFTVQNPAMIEGDHNVVTYIQGDHNVMTHVMSLLSQHIIPGAAHDDSARAPPPRCHPGTRLNLIARLTSWFNDETHQLLLWITGPAGVGKSAVVQTFAEYLSRSKLLGASVFCSRPNKRSNPHLIFITIAYQLAIRIEAYREFVVQRLSLDPQLLNRDIATQFMTFIVEPFVEKRIGVGGKRWGILLDGLDELKGEDEQCEIIQLINTFAGEHRDTPLVWIIASRPEPHISNSFDDNANQSHKSEYIPIDSTEACEDVERFLRSSFETTRKKFRQSVPRDWPTDAEFLKITAAASGLFVYGGVVMQFIRDPEYADPASRLEVLLSIIDRSNTTPTRDNPFAHLDALYHEIISSIPSQLWPTAKQLLAFMSSQGKLSIFCRASQLGTLRGMSLLFGLSPHVVYTCVIKCHSTLRVPDWKVAHKKPLAFHHASFVDYLKDSGRSREFYLGKDKDADDNVGLSLLTIWNTCSGDDNATVESSWHRYCLTLDFKPTSRATVKFHTNLFHNVVEWLTQMMSFMLEQPEDSALYAPLRQVDMVKLSYYFKAAHVLSLIHTLLTTEVDEVGLCWKIPFGQLKFGHLDFKMMSPARVHYGKSGRFSKEQLILLRPRSRDVLETFISQLETTQERCSELEVIIFGAVPQGRVAAFYCDPMYYVIPYPE